MDKVIIRPSSIPRYLENSTNEFIHNYINEKVNPSFTKATLLGSYFHALISEYFNHDKPIVEVYPDNELPKDRSSIKWLPHIEKINNGVFVLRESEHIMINNIFDNIKHDLLNILGLGENEEVIVEKKLSVSFDDFIIKGTTDMIVINHTLKTWRIIDHKTSTNFGNLMKYDFSTKGKRRLYSQLLTYAYLVDENKIIPNGYNFSGVSLVCYLLNDDIEKPVTLRYDLFLDYKETCLNWKFFIVDLAKKMSNLIYEAENLLEGDNINLTNSNNLSSYKIADCFFKW
jgi:hypothetical protein